MRNRWMVFVGAAVLSGAIVSAALASARPGAKFLDLSALQKRATATVSAKESFANVGHSLFSKPGTTVSQGVLLSGLMVNGQNPATFVYGDTIQIDFDYAPGEVAGVLMNYLDLDGDSTVTEADAQVMDRIVLVDNGPVDEDSTLGHFSARVPSLMLFPTVSNYVLLVSNGLSQAACFVSVQAPSSPAYSISGTVVQPPNTAGIVVIASFGDLDHGPEEGRLVAAVTDSSGAFFIPVPDYLGGDSAMVMAMDFLGVTDGYLMSPPQTIAVDGNVTGLTLAMVQAGAWVRVIVRDDTGNPVPDVTVYLEAEGPGTQARTDSNGIAVLGGMPDQQAGIELEEMDLWPQYMAPDDGRTPVNLVMGDTLNVPVYVHRADATIEGTVTLDGQPAAGIMFRAWAPEGYSMGYSDYSGHFSIPVWSGAQEGYWVNIDEEYVPPGYYVSGPSSSVAAGQHDVLFEIWPAAGAIYGYVTDATTGQPIEGVWVEARTDTSWAGGDDTDENGYYEIPVQNGAYRVYAWHDGYLPQMDSVVVADERVQVDFALQPFTPGAIEGMVRDQAGNPLAGINVVAHSDSFMHFEQHTQTGVDGSYRLDNLPPGDYIVEAFGDLWTRQFYDHAVMWDSATFVPVQAGATVSGIDFDLVPGGAITGVVVDSASGQPIAGAHVRVDAISDSLTPWTYWLELWAETGPDGRYVVGGLPPGNYIVEADKGELGYLPQLYDGHWPWEAPDTVLVTGGMYTPDVDFSLIRGCALRGWVYDSTGVSASGATVVAEHPDGSAHYEATTDSSGYFQIVPMEPGDYLVYATAPGYDTTWFAGPDSATWMHLMPGDWNAFANIWLQPAGPVSGVQSQAESSLPERFALHAAYPNPFNPSTTLRYDLPRAGVVRLVVVDALGRTVAVLVDGPVPAGRHAAVWDGRDQSGQPVGSGVYLAVMKAGDQRFVSKMLLLK
ncbi:MAG TPA: hypothetical protein ENK07_11175 [Bacteroidetes bacterium]|nr:hypothetical protein [Bacteroidota bacterium]